MLSGINPFKLKNKSKYEKLQMICDEDIKMMPNFSKDAVDLLTGLLKRNPEERLGSGPGGIDDIKQHIWFLDIEWEDLLAKKVEPPFKPEATESSIDTNYISKDLT